MRNAYTELSRFVRHVLSCKRSSAFITTHLCLFILRCLFSLMRIYFMLIMLNVYDTISNNFYFIVRPVGSIFLTVRSLTIIMPVQFLLIQNERPKKCFVEIIIEIHLFIEYIFGTEIIGAQKKRSV